VLHRHGQQTAVEPPAELRVVLAEEALALEAALVWAAAEELSPTKAGLGLASAEAGLVPTEARVVPSEAKLPATEAAVIVQASLAPTQTGTVAEAATGQPLTLASPKETSQGGLTVPHPVALAPPEAIGQQCRTGRRHHERH